MRYTHDNNDVYVGKALIARMYIRHDGTKELRILQGLPRNETVQDLLTHCPEFCKHNGITDRTHPLLFTPPRRSA